MQYDDDLFWLHEVIEHSWYKIILHPLLFGLHAEIFWYKVFAVFLSDWKWHGSNVLYTNNTTMTLCIFVRYNFHSVRIYISLKYHWIIIYTYLNPQNPLPTSPGLVGPLFVISYMEGMLQQCFLNNSLGQMMHQKSSTYIRRTINLT